AWRQSMKRRRNRTEQEKLPQEPGGAGRPHWQRPPVLPKCCRRRIDGGQTVRSVVGERAENGGRKQEWQSDPPPPIQQIERGALAVQARRGEQAGQEEHQRLQANILPGTEQIEAEPALMVD